MGYENGSISLINMNGEKSFDCSIHGSPVLFICASLKHLASVDCDDRILLWSIEEGSECIELEVRSLNFLLVNFRIFGEYFLIFFNINLIHKLTNSQAILNLTLPS